MYIEETKIENEWLFLYIPSIIGAMICAILLKGKNMPIKSALTISILAGLIAAFLTTLSICISKWLKRTWRKTHAFMFFLDKEYDKTKELSLPLGLSTHLFWIRSYKNLELDSITIRFVPSKGTESKCKQEPSFIIDISEAKIKWDTTEFARHKNENLELEREDPKGSSEPSKWHYHFPETFSSGLGAPFGLRIVVKARQPWNGYFSLEGRTKLDRLYGRIKVKIK